MTPGTLGHSQFARSRRTSCFRITARSAPAKLQTRANDSGWPILFMRKPLALSQVRLPLRLVLLLHLAMPWPPILLHAPAAVVVHVKGLPSHFD